MRRLFILIPAAVLSLAATWLPFTKQAMTTGVAGKGGGGAAVSDPFANYHLLKVWHPFETSLTNSAGWITNAAPDNPNVCRASPVGLSWYTNAGGSTYFNGGGIYATTEHHWLTTGPTTYIICAWVKTSGDYSLWTDDADPLNQWRFSFAGVNKLTAVVAGGTSIQSPNSFGAAWKHGAIVYNSGNVSLYENGVQVKAPTAGAYLFNSGVTGCIGTWNRGPGAYGMTGYATDIMVFTNVPSAELSNTVWSVYNARKTVRGL